MAEYINVEKPFLKKLKQLGWQVIDQGQGSYYAFIMVWWKSIGGQHSTCVSDYKKRGMHGNHLDKSLASDTGLCSWCGWESCRVGKLGNRKTT